MHTMENQPGRSKHYADDVAIPTEIIEVVHLSLAIMDEDAHPLGLMTSWKKTKVKSPSDFQQPSDAITIDDNQVEVIIMFCLLGSWIKSDCWSKADILCHIRKLAAGWPT